VIPAPLRRSIGCKSGWPDCLPLNGFKFHRHGIHRQQFKLGRGQSFEKWLGRQKFGVYLHGWTPFKRVEIFPEHTNGRRLGKENTADVVGFCVQVKI
jgi:hypothetical protein